MMIMVMLMIINITINGLKDALDEERKGFNQGDYKNMQDLWVDFFLFLEFLPLSQNIL